VQLSNPDEGFDERLVIVDEVVEGGRSIETA
jgi:hypothetical protein